MVEDVRPTAVAIAPSGAMAGRDGQYVKHLSEMTGAYRDQGAHTALVDELGGETVVYRVEENRLGAGTGALILGTSTLEPGMVGDEYAMTKGHLHRRADRAEVYYCVAGHGVMLMDRADGRSEALEMTPGVAVHVPGHWVHRSVNVGSTPLVTIFVYNEDAGQDYDLIAAAGGMSQLIVRQGAVGWKAIPNPGHRGYPKDRQ
ncbi:MAG: cupin domain-containing protein [Bifidobacteriaceae bacterium]|jgi:glucose-6-phosphate isomerase|nr:cupin domain-containing protein [Bifidobacteriaceae bacterium]